MFEVLEGEEAKSNKFQTKTEAIEHIHSRLSFSSPGVKELEKIFEANFAFTFYDGIYITMVKVGNK